MVFSVYCAMDTVKVNLPVMDGWYNYTFSLELAFIPLLTRMATLRVKLMSLEPCGVKCSVFAIIFCQQLYPMDFGNVMIMY